MEQASSLALSVSEAACALKVSPITVYRSIWRGEIRAVRIGRRLLVPRTALERLLEGQLEREQEAGR